MNGTLLLRRSASMVLASSFLFVAACGVELNGLFDGDADVDGAIARDAGRDVDASDRAADARLDAAIDTSSADASSVDRSSTDGSRDDRGGGDGTLEPPIDASSGDDAARDTGIDGGDTRDADVGGDAADRADSEGPRDTASDPLQDATAEDTSTDPRVDVPIDTPIDTPIDAVVDARADAPADTTDAGPPGTCGGACNTFDNISQTITRTVDQGSPPAMTGGTLADGTYVVTSIVQYNGDNTAYSLAETSVIAGNIDAWVAETNGQAPVRYTTTFTTTNNQLAFAFCCPAAGNLTILYTTDGTTLSHVDPANPNRIVTYTRQ